MADFTVKELVFNHEKAFLPEKAVGVNATIQYKLIGGIYQYGRAGSVKTFGSRR